MVDTLVIRHFIAVSLTALKKNENKTETQNSASLKLWTKLKQKTKSSVKFF